ncbi:nitrogenase iron-molybdenum cofactor biosynthesis protein NifN [Zoogloea sp.]|uniref:nitrogenase iron-molybdenum cofactor biosynthesis protein NifN n=1 Tax=Zoogloea sp. TaxID=49181 RepID=UPI0035B42467|nr:nitrogenase iron-molybdenum cofactor biosynthesis protein NifN [Rhodocyclales bacterium]
MNEIKKRAKPLSVSPLKASSTTGAALAFLGIAHAIPMLHGSQGCTAFAKVYFVRHFREPIPLQTTAMDQASSVMGADDNVIEGLATICAKQKPALIGLPTTGLSETQGTDVARLVKDFYRAHPEYAHVKVVPVNTPDFTGCLETGYALAVKAMFEYLVPEDRSRVGRRPRQVNVLPHASLTPGDMEALKETIESFGLRPVVVPDVGDSLDGHLMPEEYTPLTLGGTPVGEFATLGEAAATLVIGRSLGAAADTLAARTGVPDYRFDHLMGLAANDRLLGILAELSGQPVPDRYARQRAQLQDAMVDCHFMLGFARVAMAADPDLLIGMGAFLHDMGAELVSAITPVKAAGLESLPARQVIIGDLEDLERSARETDTEAGCELVIGNSHAVASAARLGVPILRIGFPQYDLVGGYTRTWIGYRGSRQTLFDLANLLLEHHEEHHVIAPYRSLFRPAEAFDPLGAAAPAPAPGGQPIH